MVRITQQIKDHIKKEVNKRVKQKTKELKKEQDKVLYTLKKKERDIETEEKAIEFQKTFNTTVIGAFTFVAGLLWRDVADSIISIFLPELQGLAGNVITALLVTVVVVIFAVSINSKTQKQEKALQRKKEKLDKEKMII